MSASAPQVGRPPGKAFPGPALLVCLTLTGCAGLMENELPAPEQVYAVRLPRVGGGELRLSEYRERVLLVDLFVTWAGPATIDMAGYAVLEGRYAARGLGVVGVALDELTEVVEPFVRGLEVPYPVALADAQVRSGRSPLGPIEVLPKLLVFDRRGRLQAVFLGLVPMDRLEALLRDLL